MRRTLLLAALTLSLCYFSPGQKKMNPSHSIFLNHFYIVLDSATYRAVEEDQFLRREFAVTEQRTTTRTDIVYTGLYFYGTNTYFEFFDANNQSIGRLGDSGIAFGVDQEGAVEAMRKEMASELSVGPAPITRQFNQKQVPWFYMAMPAGFPPGSGLSIWIMEYHPRFLAEWNPQSNSKDQGVSRKQVLQRYVDVLKEKPATPYFEDVVALTIAVDEAGQKGLSELGRQFGYGRRVEGNTTILKGPDIELRLVPRTEESRGIREVTLRVGRGPARPTDLRFGARSSLRFHGNGLATWSF